MNLLFFGFLLTFLSDNMDGNFKYCITPRRKSLNRVLSPFCTSPSQLQEVTIGPNGTLAVADQTNSSPARGRSVKEYDEELTALRKENFNLKLRIYFLEERMGPTYNIEDKDNVVRKNIEYQVEVESLRKELEDKQDLLCQALKAMELEETEHKKLVSKKDQHISELNERLEAIQKDTTTLTEMNDMLVQKQNKLLEDSSVMYTEAFNLQDANCKTKMEIEQLQQQISDLETQLAEERQTNAVYEHNLQDYEGLQLRVQNLELELKERDCKINKLSTDVELKGHTISSLNLKVRTLEDELKSKLDDLAIKETEIHQQHELIKDQLYEIDEYKKKLSNENILNDKEQRQIESLKSSIVSRDNAIAELESKLERCKSVIRNLEAKLEKIAHENKRKDEEIISMKSQRRAASANESRIWSPKPEHRNNSDYMSEKAETDDLRALREAFKKKDEQYKNACSMVQSFILSRKSLERENADLQTQVEKKDIKIIELQKELKRFNNHHLSGKTYDGLSSSFNNNKHNSGSPQSRPDYDENSGDEQTNANQTQHGDSMMITNGEKMSMDCENHLEVLMQMLEEKDNQIQEYKEMLEAATSSLKNKDNRITELEKELSELHVYLTDLKNQFEDFKIIRNHAEDKNNVEKDQKILQLESEVKKHTQNLQGIVNTELWEKNREIEKLQNRLTEKLKSKDNEIGKLEKELMGKDFQLKILKEKIEELGIHVNLPSSLVALNLEEKVEIPEEIGVLKEKLKLSNEKVKFLQKSVEELNSQLKNTPERENDTKFMEIKAQYSQLQSEFHKSEKCRQEMGSVCILLTNRLEELANFLDSLLKHKSVLGLLGIKQQSAIKNAIDQSLDLSKTFNFSLINEDKSLAQLSSLSGFLNHTMNPDLSLHESYFDISDDKRQSVNSNHGNLTYNSHLSQVKGDAQNPQDLINEQNEIILVLRQQIETLKKEIEVRDTEIAHHNLNSTDVEKSLKNDQDLLEALMNLQETPKNLEVQTPSKIYQNLFDKKTNPIASQNDQSESEAWSEPDRNVSQARIGLDVESLKSSPNSSRSKKQLSEDSFTSSSSNKSSPRTPSKRSSTERMINILQDNIMSLEKQLKEKENETLTLQCKLMENDNKIKESQLRLHEELEKVRNEKHNLENVQRMSEKLVESLETQKEDLVSKIGELNLEKNNLLTQISQKDTQIDNLIQKSKALELSIASFEENSAKLVQENDTKWKEIFSKMEEEADLRINELKETTNQLREKYEKQYLEKEELERNQEKLRMVYQELEEIKEMAKEAESKEKKYNERELELNKKLQEVERENREKIMILKRELNEYALRTSQAVLERTKVSNEKLRLEQELRRLEAREMEKASEFAEKEKQYLGLKNSIQKQMSTIDSQRVNLQLKVSELETEKVELQNRVIRLQNGDTTLLSKSSPSTPIKIQESPAMHHLGKHSLGSRFRLPKSSFDLINSGYNSEDHFTDDCLDHFNRSAPEGCNWFITNPNHNATEVSAVRNIANSSPDLGIESDPGRFSSLETNVSRPLLQTLELTASMNNLLSDNGNDHRAILCNIPSHKSLLKENEELQRKLEKTTMQLDIINKNKKQVEKAVCKQIHKTSIVLRKARANLDSGSENEVLHK